MESFIPNSRVSVDKQCHMYMSSITGPRLKMSNCELTQILDRPDLTYHFGDTVLGAVEVYVASKCVCRWLVLELEWRTHGRGDQDWGLHQRLKLFEGEWEPGWVYRYPFAFTAPNGPATYHGHNLNVDWYVRARADLDGLSKKMIERDILLIPAKPPAMDPTTSVPERLGQTPVNLGPAYRSPSTEVISERVAPGTDTLSRAKWLFFLAPFPIAFRLITYLDLIQPNPLEWIIEFIGLFVLMECLPLIIGDWMPRIGAWKFFFSAIFAFLLIATPLVLAQYSPILAPIAFGTIMAVVGLYLLFKSRRLRALGQIFIAIRPTVVKPGGNVFCQVTFKRPVIGIRPSVRATLMAREHISVGNQSRAFFIPGHVAYEKTCPLPMDPFASSGDTRTFEAPLAIPEDAPFTFSSWSNRLMWEVVLQVSANGVPAWNVSYPATVQP
jgi:hypothetical protein